MTDQYRVRVKRFGMPDQFHNKKTVGMAIKMLREWEADRTGRTKGTLDGSAELTIEVREVTEWSDITARAEDADLNVRRVLLGQGDGP